MGALGYSQDQCRYAAGIVGPPQAAPGGSPRSIADGQNACDAAEVCTGRHSQVKLPHLSYNDRATLRARAPRCDFAGTRGGYVRLSFRASRRSRCRFTSGHSALRTLYITESRALPSRRAW